SLIPPLPVTEVQKVTSSVSSAPSATPAFVKVLIRPLTWTRIWVGPTSPMLSGGMNPDSTTPTALKLVPTVCGRSGEPLAFEVDSGVDTDESMGGQWDAAAALGSSRSSRSASNSWWVSRGRVGTGGGADFPRAIAQHRLSVGCDEVDEVAGLDVRGLEVPVDREVQSDRGGALPPLIARRLGDPEALFQIGVGVDIPLPHGFEIIIDTGPGSGEEGGPGRSDLVIEADCRQSEVERPDGERR